jgi:hypothetical protein
MRDIAQKYNLLDKRSQKEVNDFMDFLLHKKEARQKSFIQKYKKRILSVSTWTENDIEAFQQHNALLGNWKIEEW